MRGAGRGCRLGELSPRVRAAQRSSRICDSTCRTPPSPHRITHAVGDEAPTKPQGDMGGSKQAFKEAPQWPRLACNLLPRGDHGQRSRRIPTGPAGVACRSESNGRPVPIWNPPEKRGNRSRNARAGSQTARFDLKATKKPPTPPQHLPGEGVLCPHCR
jgi:hypothetical protein